MVTAWTPPTVRRFSAGCAETDLVVVGSSLVAIEDAAAERERQAARKIGDVEPLPPRKLDVRPMFTGAGSPSFKAARHGARPPGK